jgi:iron complex outermembrane receptor protein
MILSRNGAVCEFANALRSMALLCVSAGVHAQAPDAGFAAAEAPQAALEEVTVTAQRRSESLKDVPISVQAISGERLETQAIVSTSDLAAIAPTLNFSTGNSVNASAFSLRGVSSLALQNGIQPSTAMVVDGVAVARQSEFIADLGDVDRIEVLNGPQGTLFGKNSTAGVINIVTHKPTGRLEGMIETLATTDSEFGVRAMLNVPLSSRVRLRVDGFYRDQEPLIRNLSGPDVIGTKTFGARLKLAVDFSDDLNLLLVGTYSHTESSGGAHVTVAPGVFGALQEAVDAPARIGRGETTVNMDQPAVDLFTPWNVSATLNWRISDELNLVSISAFSGFAEHSSVDIDETPVGIIAGKGESKPGTGYPFESVLVPFRQRFPDQFHYFSHEDRLNLVTGPVNAVLGVYYQDYHDNYALNIPFIFDGSVLGLTPGVRFYVNNTPRARIEDRTASVFGDVTYQLPHSFDVFAGLRYTYEKVNVDYHRDDFFGPAALLDPITTVFAAPPVDTLDKRAERRVFNLSGRAGIEYKPTDRLNFYFSYARGYKAPAADVSQNLEPTADPIIKPEIATNYELGAKLRLYDNRIALNLALFNQKIDSIQEGIIQPGIVFNPVLINAGELKTRGVEMDGQWAATPHLKFILGAAYDKATYAGFHYVCTSTQLRSGSCPNDPTAGFQDITGQQAIQSPKWKYSVSGEYSNSLTGSLSYYVQASWTWTDAIYYELGQDPLSREPSRGILNASFGLRGRDDRWELQLFGKNLTNHFYYSNLNDVAIVGQPLGYLARDFARYGGLRLTYRY